MHSTEPLSNWLFSKTCPYPHLYVIGLQEMIELKVDQIVSADTEKQRSNWEQGLNKVLNSARTSTESLQYSYVILRSIKLVALGIFIFVRSDNIEMIRKMEVSIVMTGLGGMAGNKGGIGVSFNYNDTNLCFITAHLAAGSSNVEERNRDYKTISNGIKFSGKTIDDHDGIFWFGDFNYRISMDGDVVRSELAKGNMHSLTSCDQVCNY